jgi:hydrogenase-4 component B
MLTPEQAVVAAILVCLGGALLTLLVSRQRTLAGWVAFVVVAASAGLVFYATGRVLTVGPSHPATFLAMPAFGFALRLYVDGLASVFLLLAALLALPASFYSIVYMRHYPTYSLARYYPYFLVFLAAMYGLVSTTDMMWFFFIFWQMMTLPGYALIRFENKNRANCRAANKYLLMMQIACLATMAGAEMLAVGGASVTGSPALKYDFDSISKSLPQLLIQRQGLVALAFGCFLVGFGIKMGVWPFGQIWLPDAHPAAPSPVSAMLSGVMIKTGVYGLMRYFLWLVPEGSRHDFPLAYWGLGVALLGTITLFTGTMQALKQEHSKRLLAFHSIGQIGYIVLGTGTCMTLLAHPGPRATVLAAVGFFGALFHTINHGLFKGLLFLNAGSMLYATGTQDLNRMGGLMKLMPVTALTALVASFSISGVPLFNGFASKWSLYVATIQGSQMQSGLVFCGLVALLTSVLTLASFIKFFGTAFLSRRSPSAEAQPAQRGSLEVSWMMQAPQVFLAALCLLLGVAPALAFGLIKLALDASRQGYGSALAYAKPMTEMPWFGLASSPGTALLAPLALALVMGVLFLGAWWLARLGHAQRRIGEPWLCGYARPSDPIRYGAHHYYGEIKRYFRWLGGAPRPAARTSSLSPNGGDGRGEGALGEGPPKPHK